MLAVAVADLQLEHFRGLVVQVAVGLVITVPGALLERLI
jgi:hypothetical protein